MWLFSPFQSRLTVSNKSHLLSADITLCPVLSSTVRGGLRAHQGRQLQEKSGSGRGGGPDRHSGHRWSGGLCCHQGQLLPQRGGVSPGLLHYRAGVLQCHCGVQVQTHQNSWESGALSHLRRKQGANSSASGGWGGAERWAVSTGPFCGGCHATCTVCF